MIVRWFAGPLIVVAVLGTEAAVSWTTVDGGGATSTAAGPYRLRGTIGQSDGATLSAEAGPSVRGGYWPGAVALSRLVFEDDFESGDTSAWSSVTPLAATAAASSGESLRSAEPGSERLGEALAAEVLPLGTPLDIPTLDTASLIAFAALILAAAGRLIHRRSST
jgi:hypothetical protein